MPVPTGALVTFVSIPFGSGGVEGISGPDMWIPAGGQGGWTQNDRRRRRQRLGFGTIPGRTLEGTILFDRFAEDGSVEDKVRAILKLGKPVKEGVDEPNPVYLFGASIAAEAQAPVQWVVQDIAVGDLVTPVRNAKGQRIRIAYDVTLLEFDLDDPINIAKKKPAAKVDCSKKKAKRKHYTLKKGETVQDVAKRELGSRDCWKVIKVVKGKSAVKIRDPKSVKPGAELRLP